MNRPLHLKLLALLAASLLATACGGDLRPDDEEPGDEDDRVVHTDLGAGVTQSRVDATSDEDWIYLDLDTGRSVLPEDASTDTDWDVAFQRFLVRTNSGTSGPGQSGAADTGLADFDGLTNVPGGTEFAIDTQVDPVRGEGSSISQNPALATWYDYDISTHSLTARETVYVVKSTAGGYFKLRFLAYYDDAGTPAVVSFKWAEVGAPDGSAPTGTLDVNASTPGQWVYVSVADGVVTPEDPATSLGWDFAVSRTAFRTNGGVSGAGVAGAQVAGDGVTFASVTSTNTLGFTSDVLVDSGIPGSTPSNANPALSTWYDYSGPPNHQTTPKDRVFALRTAEGAYAKLQILSYSGGNYVMRLAPIEVEVETVTLEFTAPNTDWLYLNLREGAFKTFGGEQVPNRPVVETDPSASVSWDLAFKGVYVQTNSGTSGPGEGGAAEAPQPDIDAVLEVPAATVFEVDAMGPPAMSGDPFTQSLVLMGWWNYDLATHVVTPHDKTFFVRTADGDFAKIKVRAYQSGQYTLDVAYAGPGATSF